MPLKGNGIVASVHPTVTVQGRRTSFVCAYPRVGGASCIRLLGTRSPIEGNVCQVKTRYPEAIIGFYH